MKTRYKVVSYCVEEYTDSNDDHWVGETEYAECLQEAIDKARLSIANDASITFEVLNPSSDEWEEYLEFGLNAATTLEVLPKEVL